MISAIWLLSAMAAPDLLAPPPTKSASEIVANSEALKVEPPKPLKIGRPRIFPETEAAGPQPVPYDRTLGFTPDDYPASALKSHAEGSVRVTAHIDARGAATDCIVESSSGNADLDQRTCDVIRTRTLFVPSVDRTGQPVASVYHSAPIVWRLPTGPSLTQAMVAQIVELPLDEANPRCTTEMEGRVSVPSMTCASLARSQAPMLKFIEPNYRKAVFVMSFSEDGTLPSIEHADWGVRLMRMTSEQRMTKRDDAISCATVATEGFAKGADACNTFVPAAPAPAPEDARDEYSRYVSTSLYGVPRTAAPSAPAESPEDRPISIMDHP